MGGGGVFYSFRIREDIRAKSDSELTNTLRSFADIKVFFSLKEILHADEFIGELCKSYFLNMTMMKPIQK